MYSLTCFKTLKQENATTCYLITQLNVTKLSLLVDETGIYVLYGGMVPKVYFYTCGSQAFSKCYRP